MGVLVQMPLELRLRPGCSFPIRGVRSLVTGDPVEEPTAQGEPVFEEPVLPGRFGKPVASGRPHLEAPVLGVKAGSEDGLPRSVFERFDARLKEYSQRKIGQAAGHHGDGHDPPPRESRRNQRQPQHFERNQRQMRGAKLGPFADHTQSHHYTHGDKHTPERPFARAGGAPPHPPQSSHTTNGLPTRPMPKIRFTW